MTDPIEIAIDKFCEYGWAGITYDGYRFLRGDMRDAMQDAISAYRDALWQPIETAPKDGTSILISSENWRTVWRGHYRAVGTSIGAEIDRFGEGWTRDNYCDINLQATKWQPLPEPPKEKG